eukprot:scaffold170448_cov23-Tisochrysis_lutea.AAC.4
MNPAIRRAHSRFNGGGLWTSVPRLRHRTRARTLRSADAREGRYLSWLLPWRAGITAPRGGAS